MNKNFRYAFYVYLYNVFYFVVIDVNFDEKQYTVNEYNREIIIGLYLSRPSPCCVDVYVEVTNDTATGKLSIN